MKNVYQQSRLTHDKQQYKCVFELVVVLNPSHEIYRTSTPIPDKYHKNNKE